MKRQWSLTVLLLLCLLNRTANAREEDSLDASLPRLDVFISLSMPKDSLLAWQAQAKRYQARLVMRGFVNNSLQETLKALTLAPDNVLQVNIDPTLFRRYGILRVPAVVVSRANRYDVVYGNTSVRAALETMGREGELQEAAVRLLKQAKEEHHA